MKPNTLTLFVYQGQTFDDEVLMLDKATKEPIDLSGRTARMQVRASIDSPTVIFELTSDAGQLVLNADGVLRFNMSADDTAALNAGVYEPQQWVYDLELVTPGATPVVERALTGAVVFSPEVTR